MSSAARARAQRHDTRVINLRIGEAINNQRVHGGSRAAIAGPRKGRTLDAPEHVGSLLGAKGRPAKTASIPGFTRILVPANTAWCSSKSRATLPALPATLAAYLSALALE